MSTQAETRLGEDEYLEIERKAEYRSEYYRGERFAMAQASFVHNQLTHRLGGILYRELQGKRCQALSTDMRVLVTPAGLFTYPDIVALCEQPRFRDTGQDTLINPSLLVEVLSPSTESYDRGWKFERYREIESLQEYVLVSTDHVHVDLYTRQSDNRWLLTSLSSPESVLELQSLDCTVKLAELYENLELTGATPQLREAAPAKPPNA